MAGRCDRKAGVLSSDPDGGDGNPSAFPATRASTTESALYRRVWRWHFYAGLICLPFLATMALTGALYLYKVPIESLVYSRLLFVPPTQASALDAESLVARAREAEPGKVVRFVAPPQAGHSAEVGIRTAEGAISVYLDPASGQVLGRLRDDLKLMEVIKQVHSLAIAGTVANHWIEVVAGWAIVLVVSGTFLWWPRGQSGGVCSLRGRPAQRTWWRDLHAVTGIAAAAAILFLAVTGMPWSAFWGAQFGRLTNEWGVGLPRYLFGPAPQSSLPLASLGEVPWALTQARLPLSAPHADHATVTPPAETAEAEVTAPAIGLNEAQRIYARLGLPAGTPVSLPDGPRGAYTAMLFPDDARAQRVVHLDRYSGAVIADVGYPQYGVAGRLTEWGVNLHTGRQFGWGNQLVMLAGCLAIVALAVSAAVMWWKRRPRGRLAAPPRRAGDRAAWSAIAAAVLLGLIYPLLGASMLLALLVDTAVPSRWHERFGL
ncbi:PepSY domain-containing protein [Zoogloea sp.]|uniref:PepSY-associated TM helix domain-containing protein n=1 Tax=Zoogloea sp. TaxID=49181 RepID=UPI00262575CF|nr:PepSY domain-containing protein [Zoogloea sp.]MDD3354020.1 PepSY domain-containing protein [Zoogloea sp.]